MFKGYFSWHNEFDGNVIDFGPAPDGETYFITALYLAHLKWGSSTSSDKSNVTDTDLSTDMSITNYRGWADRIQNDVVYHEGEIDGTTLSGSLFNAPNSTIAQ